MRTQRDIGFGVVRKPVIERSDVRLKIRKSTCGAISAIYCTCPDFIGRGAVGYTTGRIRAQRPPGSFSIMIFLTPRPPNSLAVFVLTKKGYKNMKTTKYFLRSMTFAISLTMTNSKNLYAVVAEKQCRLGYVQCTADCCAPSSSQCASQCGTGGGSSGSGGGGNFELPTCEPGEYISGGSCHTCPTPGTTGALTGALITTCYIPANTTQTDETGAYVYTEDCHYTK